MNYVARLSWSESGPVLVRKFLAEKGVALVILPVRHDVLETTPLLREELVVAVAPQSPFAARKTVLDLL